MDSKKFNKIMLIVAISAIILTLIGTILLFTNYSFKQPSELDTNNTTSGVISLNIAKEKQEYASNGKISLDIVNDLKNNLEE